MSKQEMSKLTLHCRSVQSAMVHKVPVKVSVEDGTITIQLPLKLVFAGAGTKPRGRRRPDWTILKKTRGMWRHRRVDGLEYERSVRGEWNRCAAR